MTLTAKDVAEITRLLEASNFDELYLEFEGLKLSLRRQAAGHSASEIAPVTHAGVPRPAPPAAGPTTVGSKPVAAAGAAAGILLKDSEEIPAPLLGTFYRAPKPGAAPFVEIGATLQEDTIIGIIEVMKLMNTVRAGVRGTVSEILARDGVLVEYGETLMRVSRLP